MMPQEIDPLGVQQLNIAVDEVGATNQQRLTVVTGTLPFSLCSVSLYNTQFRPRGDFTSTSRLSSRLQRGRHTRTFIAHRTASQTCSTAIHRRNTHSIADDVAVLSSDRALLPSTQLVLRRLLPFVAGRPEHGPPVHLDSRVQACPRARSSLPSALEGKQAVLEAARATTPVLQDRSLHRRPGPYGLLLQTLLFLSGT